MEIVRRIDAFILNPFSRQVCEKEAVETLLGPELQRDQLGGYRWIDASSQQSLTQSLFPKECRTIQ